MNVFVNDESVDFHGDSVADLIAQLGLKPEGIAVAYNMNIISRDTWKDFHIEEGMKFIVIKAACGG
ncbi:MAG: sulfur carrier protein ThiS [Marinilabiliaceae bacterium]|jgi:thiamine biosynthesis protein ThiS|nr:sulfur carrier protein ThiS [Bacteroidales bacterium]MCR5696918.1 sulfur carrier protein ThiS [Marinilabiliaceae bacterium]